jgi:excisionase family DNA binding protein
MSTPAPTVAPEAVMLTLDEAATHLRMSVKTIRRAIATTGRHHLNATKIRGQWRIHPTDLTAWVASFQGGTR